MSATSASTSLKRLPDHRLDDDRGSGASFPPAWLLAQGDDVVPIPGTRRVERLEENTAAVDLTLTPEQLGSLTAAIPPDQVAGERYDTTGMTGVNL